MKTRIIALIGMLLVLASCASSSTTLSIRTSEFKYDPPQWTVPTGQRVTVRLINDGNEEHEWVLLKPGEQVTMPFDDDDEDKIAFEVEVEPAGTKVGFFTAPASGTYTIVCGAKGHLETGMKGTLVVK